MSKKPSEPKTVSFTGIAAAHRDYVRALRSGGFVCFLPRIIDPAWSGPAPLLAGFPISVSFTGLPPNLECQPFPFAVTSCYWFDPSSYYEDETVRTMLYHPKTPCRYGVELLYDKREPRWEGKKFRQEKVLLWASGLELGQFIIQLTSRGTEPDEPCRPLRTPEETASAGVFVFMPRSAIDK